MWSIRPNDGFQIGTTLLVRVEQGLGRFYNPDWNSLAYAEEFLDAMKHANVKDPFIIEATAKKDQRGVLIGLGDLDNPSDAAKTLTTILGDKCHIPVHFTFWKGALTKDAFDLFIAPP